MNVRTSTVALGALFSVALISLGGATAGASPVVKETKKDQPVVVKVVAGDTLEAIATKHKTTYVRLFNANKKIANPDMIDVGDKVRIPKADEKLTDRFDALQAVAAVAQPAASGSYQQASYAAPQASYYTAQSSAPRGSSDGNTYAFGNCTWYVKSRRSDLPNMLGNGGSWAANASSQGFATGSAPRAGAVAEQPGHVAYVEQVHGNGTVTISEMNYAGGFNKVSSRTVPASNFNYIY